MMSLFKKIMTVFVLCFSLTVHAELRIDVSGAQSDPLPFAMPNLIGNSWSSTNTGIEITEVVVADLERSGLFRYINPEAYIQRLTSINARPNFADWQAIQAQALIYGTIEEIGSKISKAYQTSDCHF